MPSQDLKLGYETGTGDEVHVPAFHSAVTGITRHGKTETMKSLSRRAEREGYTVLMFDVKTPRDYDDIGSEIPIYLEETTDPTTVKGLLESSSGISLSYQYSELIKVYEQGDTFDDMLTRIEGMMQDDDRHPVEEDKLRVLQHLLEELTDELGDAEVSDSLELQTGINVMDLHDVDESVQQLAIAATVEEVLDNHEDVILVLDEAHNFIPQSGSPPAHGNLVRALREGAAKNVWVWLSDQTITGVDKEPLKQVGVWVLGKQREKNEAQRVLDQIPAKTSFSSNDVMTLSKGHFIVALDDEHPLTYVQPTWASDQDARAVALGEHDVDALDTEQPEQEVQEMEDEIQEKDRTNRELREQLDEARQRIEELEEENEKLERLLEEERESETSTADVDESRVQEIVDDRLDERFGDLVSEVEIPEGVRVEAGVPKLEVVHETEPLELGTDSLKGKIAYLYAEDELPDGWFSTGEVYDAMKSRGWSQDPRTSDVLNEMCSWGYLRKSGGKFKVKISPDEAKKQGLVDGGA
jgi:hypothetical protein